MTATMQDQHLHTLHTMQPSITVEHVPARKSLMQEAFYLDSSVSLLLLAQLL